MDDYLGQASNIDFPITVADGVYAHFLEGFVSLIFYQIRATPQGDDGKNLRLEKRTEIIGDIRLSIRNAKKMLEEMQTGFEVLPTMRLLDNDSDFLTGVVKSNSTVELGNANWTEEKFERIAAGVHTDSFKELLPENKEKWLKLLVKLFEDNVDSFIEIKRKDEQERKIKQKNEIK